MVIQDLVAVLVLGATIASGSSSTSPDAVSQKLIVGTKVAPPFAMKSPDGVWQGISIELWRRVADRMELEYELREMDLPTLIRSLEDGSIDAAVAALTVTEERESRFDFSHPFHSAGLGIAVRPSPGGRWFSVVRRFVSFEFLTVVAVLSLLLLIVGTIVWLFERKRNAVQFGGKPSQGIGSAFWWAAVTMSTVGYGDKAPVTLGGRILGLIWIFAGIILISAFTAAITSSLTVSQLEAAVRGPEDLPRVRVATVAETTSSRYLRRRGIAHYTFASPREALDALVNSRVDAVVYDEPILRHMALTSPRPVRVLPTSFEPQNYAIGLKANSPLREPMNRAILHVLDEPEWEPVLRRNLGG